MIGFFELLLIGFVVLLIFATARSSLPRSRAAKATTLDASGRRESGSFFRSSLGQRVPRVLLVVIRLVQGPMWLSTGWHGIGADAAAETMRQIVDAIESGRTYVFFLPFLESMVLPYSQIAVMLVTAGEIFVGLTVTLGLMTRLGAATGMVLAFTYACAYGDTMLPVDGYWISFCYLLPVLIGAAGRSFGLDYWLHRRWPRLPIW